MTRSKKPKLNFIYQRAGLIGGFAILFQAITPLVGYALQQVESARVKRSTEKPCDEVPMEARVMRKSEMQNFRGRGRTPSMAGQSKWDIVDNGVNLRTRNFTYTANDLSLPGAVGMPVSVVRTWNANDDREGPFGKGWSWSLDVRQAAGGLIRRKGSPSRAVATQMNNGRSLKVTQIVGTVIQSSEHDGISMQDAAGDQWLAWRDADGLYTPPPWDQNEYESDYMPVSWTEGSNQYERHYPLTTRVLTPDGTLYTYETVLQDNDLPSVIINGQEVFSEQVLTRVQDRHGNETLYQYMYEEVEHTYWDGSDWDTTSVRKAFVVSITNARGYRLEVEWITIQGVDYPRVESIASKAPGNTLLESVHYEYGISGPSTGTLTQVYRQFSNQDPVLIASYGYTDWQPQSSYVSFLANIKIPAYETGLLSSITDGDGITTNIMYNTGEGPSSDTLWYSVAVSAVSLPNEQSVEYRGGETSTQVLVRYKSQGACLSREVHFTTEGSDSNAVMKVKEQGHDGHHERAFRKVFQWMIKDEWVRYGITHAYSTDPCAPTALNALPSFVQYAEGQDLRTVPTHLNIGTPLGNLTFITTEYQAYNCFGQPLEVRYLTRSMLNLLTNPPTTHESSVDQDWTQTIEYHGASKYYQKHRENDAANRWVRYHYFDSTAPQGFKGQLQAVYSESFSNSTPLSQVLEYNENGQPVLTAALQKVDGSGNPTRWIYTKTLYEDEEGENDDMTGQPQKVIEDYRYPSDSTAAANGINRVNTTRYDVLGRPTHQSTYSRDNSDPEYANPSLLERRVRTTYDAETGQVIALDRVNSSDQVVQQLASYTYTPGGRTLTAEDHQSDIKNVVNYDASGRVESTEEQWDTVKRYETQYEYDGADLKGKTLSVYTPNQSTQTWKWRYSHYITGYTFPLNRTFTRTALVEAKQGTNDIEIGAFPGEPIVVDYIYDWLTLRLRAARFNVVPGQSDNLLEDHITEQAPEEFAFAWYVYDPVGRITDLRYYKATLSGQSYTYTPWNKFSYHNTTSPYLPAYNAVGNRTNARFYEYSGSTPVLARSEAYTYDVLDRLTVAQYTDWTLGDPATASDSWSYDVMGNRANSGQTWSYDGLNRITSRPNVTYSHDLLGNRLSETGKTYAWDDTDRLESYTAGSTTFDYTYRSDGLRTKSTKTVGESSTRTEYLYDGQMPVIEQEFDSSGDLTMTRMNLLGARGIEAVINVPVSGSATMNWLMVDGHGNVVRTMNTNFGLSAYQWRGVWGERQTGTLQTRKGYVANLGHQEDETGLVYMRARYYEPTTGRFVSEDPARDGVNWYLYADANPVNKVDASGNASMEEIRDWILAIVGARLAWEFLKPLFGKPIQLLGLALLDYSNKLINGGMAQLVAGLIELRAAGFGGFVFQSIGLGLKGIGRSLLGASELAIGIGLRYVAYYLIAVGEGMLPETFR